MLVKNPHPTLRVLIYVRQHVLMSEKSNFFGFSIRGLTGRKAVKNNHGLINCECLVAKLYITNLADRHWLLVFSREWLAGWLARKWNIYFPVWKAKWRGRIFKENPCAWKSPFHVLYWHKSLSVTTESYI